VKAYQETELQKTDGKGVSSNHESNSRRDLLRGVTFFRKIVNDFCSEETENGCGPSRKLLGASEEEVDGRPNVLTSAFA
jgi:hypothetical protein